jgi:hypothetical protein
MEIVVKPLQASLLAGAAAMMIAGTAFAQSPNTHVLTVQLPGGGVEQIQYTGDTPPQVFLDASPARADSLWFFSGFGPDSPFAALDRMSEELNRRAARMLEQAEAMTRNLRSNPDQLIQAYSGSLAAGGQSYSIISTVTSNGVCGRSVEITSQGNGRQPHVVTRSFGNCGTGAHGPAGSIAVPSKSKQRPETITASAKTGADAKTGNTAKLREAALHY